MAKRRNPNRRPARGMGNHEPQSPNKPLSFEMNRRAHVMHWGKGATVEGASDRSVRKQTSKQTQSR
jgi:hypothetical protein